MTHSRWPTHRWTLTCPVCGLAHTVDRPLNLRPSAYRYCPTCQKTRDFNRVEGPKVEPLRRRSRP